MQRTKNKPQRQRKDAERQSADRRLCLRIADHGGRFRHRAERFRQPERDDAEHQDQKLREQGKEILIKQLLSRAADMGAVILECFHFFALSLISDPVDGQNASLVHSPSGPDRFCQTM